MTGSGGADMEAGGCSTRAAARRNARESEVALPSSEGGHGRVGCEKGLVRRRGRKVLRWSTSVRWRGKSRGKWALRGRFDERRTRALAQWGRTGWRERAQRWPANERGARELAWGRTEMRERAQIWRSDGRGARELAWGQPELRERAQLWPTNGRGARELARGQTEMRERAQLWPANEREARELAWGCDGESALEQTWARAFVEG